MIILQGAIKIHSKRVCLLEALQNLKKKILKINAFPDVIRKGTHLQECSLEMSVSVESAVLVILKITRLQKIDAIRTVRVSLQKNVVVILQ